MKKFDCECNNCTSVLVDGYSVGDKLLEGIIFRATIDSDDIKVKVTEAHADYFEQFNTKMWLDAIKTEVLEADILICEQCKNDAILE